MPLVQPQKTRGAAAKKTRGATAPFEPPFPTPLFKLKLLLLVATCDQSNAQVTVCESLCCVDPTEFYQPTSSDISFEKLHQELSLLVTLIRQALPTFIKVTSIRTICEAMNSQVVYKSMLSEVHNILGYI